MDSPFAPVRPTQPSELNRLARQPRSPLLPAQIARALGDGKRLPDDRDFDRFLPRELRRASPRHWTPRPGSKSWAFTPSSTSARELASFAWPARC
jgi:hypothetical protein